MLMMQKIKKKAIVNKLNVIQIYLFQMTIIYKQYANKFIKWFGNLYILFYSDIFTFRMFLHYFDI